MTGPATLAIDYGERRVGIAISDPTGRLARPLAVVRRKAGEPWAGLLAPIIREHAPGTVVMGYPKRADGSPGELAAAIQELAEELRTLCGVRIVMWDESLTTLEAAEKLRQAGMSRRKRRAKIDCAAAAVILQDYLDAKPPKGSP